MFDGKSLLYTVYEIHNMVVLSVNPVGLGGWLWGSSLKHRKELHLKQKQNTFNTVRRSTLMLHVCLSCQFTIATPL